MDAHIETSTWDLPECFEFLKVNGNVSDMEMYSVFNCGIGFIMMISFEDYMKLEENENDLEYIKLGRICNKYDDYNKYTKTKINNKTKLNKEGVNMYL